MAKIKKILAWKSLDDNFVVIDSQFPQKEPFAFRNAEINEYIKKIAGFKSFTMSPMLPGPEAWFSHGYGVTHEEFLENKKGYLQYYPSNKSNIYYLDENHKYNFRLAYSFFLAETYVLLPFFENNKIPFVFVLYPGGGFGIDNNASDNMLKKLFMSKYFRGVIVTQKLTQEYLLKKELCDKNKIKYIYGSIVQFKKEEVLPKVSMTDKGTFDVCFVAAKYTEKGIDKGYDLFIESAKILYKAIPNIKFHVVGGFSVDDIDVTDLKDSIKFYGYKTPSFLRKFYSKMDIFLSPNRPFKIYEGNFDGFPLGMDASYCGVALFVSDELKMNIEYEVNKEIVIIPLSPKKIAEKIEYFYHHYELLSKIAKRGQTRTQTILDLNLQVEQRIQFFSKYTDIKRIR